MMRGGCREVRASPAWPKRSRASARRRPDDGDRRICAQKRKGEARGLALRESQPSLLLPGVARRPIGLGVVRPNYARDDFVAVAAIENEYVRAARDIEGNRIPPVPRLLEIVAVHDRHRQRRQVAANPKGGVEAVEMGVDDPELVVVVLIRVRARRIRVALVLVVIHAGVLRAAVLALMSETERVADLLADHVLLLGQIHR